MRKLIGVLVCGWILAACVVSAIAGPEYVTRYGGPQNPNFFIRVPDTTCAVASDTLAGPSVDCFLARQVVWKVTATSGSGTSLLVAEVSNNDSTWTAISTLAQVEALSDFTVGDSLNNGGVTVSIVANDDVDGATIGIPWKFTRLVIRRKVGHTAGDNASPTILCRTKLDSVFFEATIQRAAP